MCRSHRASRGSDGRCSHASTTPRSFSGVELACPIGVHNSPGIAPDGCDDVAAPLRIAFIGTGRMARNHLRALRRIRTRHSVIGVCDRDFRAAQEFAKITNATAYRTLQELCSVARPHIVHVCTSAGAHADPAREALLAGCHVYVEKPFVETVSDAKGLLALAGERGLLVCPGHQQLRDPAYGQLLRRAFELSAPVAVESRLTFRPVGVDVERAGAATLSAQLLDVLPHPLYTLVAVLERLADDPDDLAITHVSATPTELHAFVRAGTVRGYLEVDLRRRPVASSLEIAGTGGSLTADFIRGTVVGAANPGTTALEKMANPIVEACQLGIRSSVGVVRRLATGGEYPGLATLIGDFYRAVVRGDPPPIAPDHLRRVTALYETLAARVRETAGRERAALRRAAPPLEPVLDPALVVVTGARGFFGGEIASVLARRGYRVRGLTRTAGAQRRDVHEWRQVDLGKETSPDAFAGATVVVHAAAATAGGYDAHHRDSIDATHNVLRAMREAGVRRLVYISSLSVLRPPRPPWECQDERTPLVASAARELGPYTWGKGEAERLVQDQQAPSGVAARIIRPAALLDLATPEVPGLVGRRLFGRWHLGFGRPQLPFAAVDVRQAAEVVAWTVEEFDDTPPILNLFDPSIPDRGSLLALFRTRGWRGRMVWIPIPVFAATYRAARAVMQLITRDGPPRLAMYRILQPRRYDPTLVKRVLAATSRVRPLVPQLDS